MNSSAIHARQPERQIEALLHEWLLGYFNGAPHFSPLGDVTLPRCDLLFNQADLPSPQRNPQIHTVFTGWRQHACGWVSGDLGTWTSTLATPASGVRYGATTEGTIEESVHGKLVRTFAGTDIRWRAVGSAFVEEVFHAGAWELIRTFADVTEIKWIRDGLLYREQVRRNGGWVTERTVTPASPVWDGTTARLTCDVEMSFFLRVGYLGGDHRKSDFLCQTVAAGLDELLRDPVARAPLNQRGLRAVAHRSGPRPLPTPGYATRLLVHSAKLECRLPRET